MITKKIGKKRKDATKSANISSASKISDYPLQSGVISPEYDLPDIQATSYQSQFPHNYQALEKDAHHGQYSDQFSSTPIAPQAQYLTPEEEFDDLPDISVNIPNSQTFTNIGSLNANPSFAVEEEGLPDISFNPSSNFPSFPPNFTIPSFNIQNIPLVNSTVYTSNDFQGNSYIPNEDFDLPDISPSSQNWVSNEEAQLNNYNYQIPQITQPNTSMPINENPQFKKVSGLVSIKEEIEEEIEKEIEKEPEEVVKNKRVIIDLPLTLKCGFCEHERFESDFFPMHFGEEKEAICKMCWNINMYTAKKEKIPILNECSTCDESKHRYFGEKICPNNCIVCEDCQYCYIFNCKIRNRKEESCVFCDRKLVNKEQPWTLVA